MKLKLFLILLIWLAPFLMALDPEKNIDAYDVQVWNIESGLPSNSVFAILQTRNGYLWFGTQEGLVRFDGMQFEVFTRSKVPQLKSNVIRALYEDHRGTLWIGTTDGGLTAYSGGTFTTYPVGQHPALDCISSIKEDDVGNLWIGSFRQGLTRFKDGQFTTFTVKDGLPHNQVRWLSSGDHKGLGVVTSTGIVRLNNKVGTDTQPAFEMFPANQPNTSLKTVCLYKEDSGEFWVGTGDKGLLRFKDGQFESFGVARGLPNPTVNCLYQDSHQVLWIGTDGGGLTRLKDGKLETLHPGNGLVDGFVYSIYQDREGSLWVGTIEGGLHQLRDTQFTTITASNGLAGNHASFIYQTSGKHTWIGTKNGLNRIENGKITRTLTQKEGLPDNMVLCMNENRSGALWVGTFQGIFVMNTKENANKTITKTDGLIDNRVRSIVEDAEGNTWIGTEKGLNRLKYQPRSKSYDITLFTTEDGLLHNFIEFLFLGPQKTLWVSTNNGLNRYENNRFIPYSPFSSNRQLHYNCVYIEADGTLWFGSNSGLVNVKDNASFLFTTHHGLIENNVYSVLDDDHGYLWLAGRSGVSRVAKKQLQEIVSGKDSKLTPTWFNENDGLKSRWCTGEGFKTDDGNLWFPTTKGASMVNPSKIMTPSAPPPLIIEHLIVDGEVMDVDALDSGETGPSTIKIKAGTKRLAFYYTGIGFRDPHKIRFKVKLEGYDNQWVDMGNMRNTTYTGLTPGDYRFFVAAASADGQWSDKSTSLSFHVSPYFYQTIWFFLIAISMLLLTVFIIIRLRIRNLKMRAEELAYIVEKRTHTLEEQNIQLENTREKLKELDEDKSRFYTNVSHEFRTPLTLIMGPLEELLAETVEPEKKKRLLLMMRNSRRLLTLVDQLLELAKFEGGKLTLEAAKQNIIAFVKNITACFEPLARQNQVRLEFHAEDDNIQLYFDPEKLEKIITNLLSNSFNYTPSGGRIRVTVKNLEPGGAYPNGCVELSTRDTGNGIPQEQLPYIFDRFYRGRSTHDYKRKGTGIGLALTKELVELHRGDICVRSSTRNDETRGTEFVLRLPLGDSHLEPGEISSSSNQHKQVSSVQEIEDIDQMAQSDTTETVEETEQPPLVLVVEDDEDVRSYIKIFLDVHFKVIEASDGREGILKAKDHIPDLIVSDVIMPDIDGHELCRTLKNDVLTSHIPIILLTAKVSQASMLEGLETGADDYITKPFSPTVLISRIKNLIDLRRQLQLVRKNRLVLQPDEIPVSPIDDSFYKTLQEHIDAHLSDPEFNVDALSRLMEMSGATLYRKVHALTGHPPSRFIRAIRLKRAAQMLKAGENNIAKVAQRVGFPDNSYFSRCFKEQFQCSPSDFNEFKSGPAAVFEMLDAQPQEDGKGTEEKDLILVIEDNPDALKYIRESLESEYHILEASDGDKGTLKALETIPDLIISDVMMPGRDGFQVCQTLKGDIRTSHIPIILLTARASEDAIVQGLEKGADDYITKPFNTQILRTRIKNLIKLRSHLQKSRNREMSFLPIKLSDSQMDQEFMNELHKVMEHNISDQDFNVEQLAKKLYMSSATLYRKLQALTDEIPSQYIRSYRLQRAAQLLRNNFGSVTEVAFEVGFSSRAYFTRCFKEKFQQSPTDYMASQGVQK